MGKGEIMLIKEGKRGRGNERIVFNRGRKKRMGKGRIMLIEEGEIEREMGYIRECGRGR